MDAYYWNKRLNPFWLNTVRQLYKSGGNITEFLREEFDESSNSSEIIEIAYDLQAGTYLEEYTKTSKGKELRDSYAEEMYSLLSPHLTPKCSLMDAGTGELLALTLIAKNLDIQIEIFAFDISSSKLKDDERVKPSLIFFSNSLFLLIKNNTFSSICSSLVLNKFLDCLIIESIKCILSITF